jgi:hypothetical protein
MYHSAIANIIPADTVMLTDAPWMPNEGINLKFNPTFAKAAVAEEYITTGGIPTDAR